MAENDYFVNDVDRDLEARVTNYLLGHRMPALRNIEVEATGGIVTLRGKVASYYQKQLCLNCCRRVAGVIRLIEQVAVAPMEDHRLAMAS